jgi:hypothetical protein
MQVQDSKLEQLSADYRREMEAAVELVEQQNSMAMGLEAQVGETAKMCSPVFMVVGF